MLLNGTCILLADEAATAAETAETASTSLFSGNLLNIVMLIAGLYILYSGIKGKGQMFDTSVIKEDKKGEYVKIVRTGYILMGVCMLINAGTSFLKGYIYPDNGTEAAFNLGKFAFFTPLFANIVNYVTWGLVIAGILLTMLIVRKYTDQEAVARQQKEAEEERKKNPQYGHKLPVSAFEFDGDESSGSETDGNTDAEGAVAGQTYADGANTQDETDLEAGPVEE